MSTLFSGNGFGINTNIFETNILNLAVVIAVVISFVGDALRELLDNRKKKILDNISLADSREQEMEARIQQAKDELQKAEQRAIDIREQGLASAEREKALCITQAETEATRLKQLKEDSLRFQQQKAIKSISRQIVGLSMEKAHENLDKHIKRPSFQLWINKVKMGHYVEIMEDLAIQAEENRTRIVAK